MCPSLSKLRCEEIVKILHENQILTNEILFFFHPFLNSKIEKNENIGIILFAKLFAKPFR